MFITASNNVNIRLNNPQVASPCGGFVAVNGQAQVTGIQVGDMIDGNSLWYVTTQNQFLWSGGFIATGDLLLDSNQQPVTLSPETLMAVYQSAMNELTSQFKFNYPDCKGLGFGQNDNGLALFVYFDQQPAVSPPASQNYRGVQLTVAPHLTGGVKSCAVYSDNNVPFLMGGTLADTAVAAAKGFGSRSAFIQINNAGKYLLTCYHVACASPSAHNPTTYVGGGTVEIPAPASLSAVAPGQFPIHEGTLAPKLDYAIIDVSAQFNNFQNQIPGGIGFIRSFYLSNEIPGKLVEGQALTSFGAATQKAAGVLVHYNTSAITIDYSDEGYGSVDMYGLVTASNACVPGDSGGPVVDEKNKLLGYIVAADKIPGGNCYIMPVGDLFLNHNFSLI